MEGIHVGRSGLQVSRLCLGTMIFGRQRDQSEAFAIMDTAAELGIDFIDVADVYPVPPSSETWGRTEDIVGAWLQGKRVGVRANILLPRLYGGVRRRGGRASGMGGLPYSPLGAGVLTGKSRRGEKRPAESRFAQGDYGRMYQGRYWNDRMFDVADAVAELARDEGCTPAQLAVAWLLAQPDVTAPIIGASKPEQLVETAKAVGLSLSEATLQRLDPVSQPFR